MVPICKELAGDREVTSSSAPPPPPLKFLFEIKLLFILNSFFQRNSWVSLTVHLKKQGGLLTFCIME
jgi:hypothetical protein